MKGGNYRGDVEIRTTIAPPLCATARSRVNGNVGRQRANASHSGGRGYDFARDVTSDGRPFYPGTCAMAAKPKSIDEYLAGVTDEQRPALERLRKSIRAAAPKAEACISYGLAAFRLNGMLVAFGATKNHCAFYLMSSST